MLRPIRAAFAALTLAAFALPVAHAQVYPAKPIRLIVPYPAGGGTDFFARTVAVQLSQQMGQQVLVENRPGAATIIGAEAAAKSAPDGYTVLLGDTATFAVNPSLYKKLPYDPQKDLAPVTLTGRFALLRVVNPAAIQANSVKELVENAMKAPGKTDYASPGPGSPHHLAMELFKQRTGLQLTHVPYKGAGPAIQDLLGGRIPLMFLDLAAGAPQIKGGRLKALAVASDKRISALPELGPIGSQGLAQKRDFLAPVAAFEDKNGKCEVVAKFLGNLWTTEVRHSPLDVVAWHGNWAPYKYDLARFMAINTVSFDHPDPSIFTVLTSPSGQPGVANCDFVIFPPRWMVAEHTFRPPWFHRNIMSELMGLVHGVYDAKAEGFLPGGISIHNCLQGHGPDVATFVKASAADLRPHKIEDTLAFMWESKFIFRPTKFALGAPQLQNNYDMVWSGFKKHFSTVRPAPRT